MVACGAHGVTRLTNPATELPGRRTWRLQTTFTALLALAAGCCASTAADIDFRRDIQPIFAAHCYRCHGSDKQKNGLRLDLKQDALRGGDSGPVIVRGHSGKSLLFRNVSGANPDKVMPPREGGGEPLTPAQVALLGRWIDAGAPWPDPTAVELAAAGQSQHWAFRPPQRPAVPQVKNKRWVTNPIDSFVLARLERERIKPAPEADRRTLIRRLCLDLLGLLPTPDEVEEFVNDRRSNAYDERVDRLLASPHFGERWGRHWLDLARYADSDGYEKDRPRPYAYLYRDWVIDAINRDLPFDQFTIEQLAGDLLPNATLGQKIATGFHRQTLTNTEGGVDQEEFRCKAVVDRVNTTGAVWLGLTVGCAECHSHKYDPISQREFYQLFAFFNDASETNLPAPQPTELAAYNAARQKWDQDCVKLKAELDDYVKNQGSTRFEEWLKSAPSAVVPWTVLAPAAVSASGGTTLKIEADKSIQASGKTPATDTYTVEVMAPLKDITGFRLEAIDDSAPKKGPGRAKDGNFVLTGFTVTLIPTSGGASLPIVLQNPAADFAQKNFPVNAVLENNSQRGWAVAPQLNQSHQAVFEARENLTVPAGAKLVFTLDHQFKQEYLLGRFRLAATSAPRPLKVDSTPDAIAALLTLAPGQRNAKQNEALSAYHRKSVDPESRKLMAQLEQHEKKAPVYPPTRAAVLAVEPNGRETRIHIRGNFMDRGDRVGAGTPAVLHAFQPRGERPDRLDLARWLMDPANPLTGRVTVNHVWKLLFGRGLVHTVDDFGTRGEKPSHPELLDWLATEYPRLGWSRKALIRLIVTSSTYRQSSVVRPELASRDPNNVLLARQSRFRLDAENVRDIYLAASGLLNPGVGGPSIRPPLPADIAALGYANSVKWQESPGTEKYRRGLYVFFQRTVPYPMLMTFDAPDSNTTCTRRERSNTPLQALTLLNDPVFFECARGLGQRMGEAGSEDVRERITRGFELCLARRPTSAEMKRLLALYDQQSKLVRRDLENAARIAGAKQEDDPDLAEKATLVAMGRVLLNLDEFITRE